jgi:hypothetical protein
VGCVLRNSLDRLEATGVPGPKVWVLVVVFIAQHNQNPAPIVPTKQPRI